MDSLILGEVLARLQSKSNPRTTHARALGREEAFEGILEDLLQQQIPPEAEAIERRFGHLCANRATKHRRRACLLRRWGRSHSHDIPDPSDRLVTQELLRHVRGVVPATDYGYLRELAEERSYAEVAARHGLSEGNLKLRVCRARARARKVLTER